MKWRSTTIVAVRRDGRVALAGDGQVTLGQIAMKHRTRKVLRIADGSVLAGFAGGAADGLTLLDRVESQIRESRGDLERAVMGFAKEWRTDRMLRRLEAMLILADTHHLFVLGGGGDVVRPDGDSVAIGSGGSLAQAAAVAMLRHTALDPTFIAREAVAIAAEQCVYTNQEITVEALPD